MNGDENRNEDSIVLIRPFTEQDFTENKAAIEREPESIALRERRVIALVMAGDWPTAVAELRGALSMMPHALSLRMLLGAILIESAGQAEAGIAELDSAVRSATVQAADKDNKEAQFNLIVALRTLSKALWTVGKRQESFAALDSAIGGAASLGSERLIEILRNERLTRERES